MKIFTKENKKILTVSKIIVFLLAIICSGCISSYRPMHLSQVCFSEIQQIETKGEVFISWAYNVLSESGNELFALNETEALFSKRSLLAIRIQNKGKETLVFPDDLQIFSGKKLLKPLSSKKAFHLLKMDNEEASDNVIGNTYQGILFLNNLASNREFKKDIQSYYLESAQVFPGETVVGVIALKIAPGAELKFVTGKK